MQWSKLKKHIESMIYEPLRGRIKFYNTVYRKSEYDRDGRCWITLDGKEVFEASTRKWIEDHRKYINMYYEDIIKETNRKGIYSEDEFCDALKEYLLLTIEKAIKSDNLIIRGIALVDRRLSKSKFKSLDIPNDEHPFIKAMYNVRAEAIIDRSGNS